MLSASQYPAEWKSSSFLDLCALIRHGPQIFQVGHRVSSQLLPHHGVANIGVEDSDDRDLLQVSWGNTNDDAPEPLDVSAEWFLRPLL